MAKKVFIGIGHGGSDPGACAYGYRETDLALQIGLYLNEILQKAGLETQISRTADIDDDLTPKINRCNAYDPDLAVDIHINAGGGYGFEALATYNTNSKAWDAARAIINHLGDIPTDSRGIKTRLNSAGSDYFGFIRQVAAPSLILEAGFIDNRADLEHFKTSAGLKKYAKCYAAGILDFFDIKAAPEKEEKEADKMESIIYKTLADVPAWGKETIKKVLDKGYLAGTGNNQINVSYDLVRTLVALDRAGSFDKE